MFKNWYLIQTKPREECVAEKNISSQGFEVYLPKFALNKKDKPLFPGYIFVHLADNINWKPLLSTKGVARFVRFGHDFATIPERVIGSIMDNESNTIKKYVNVSKFKKGDKLAITSGLLKDVNVCFEQYTIDERIVVLFSMLNQKQKTTIEKSQVVKI